ncbi:MAG: hypothetical protein ABEJ65_11670 [bacterium]
MSNRDSDDNGLQLPDDYAEDTGASKQESSRETESLSILDQYEIFPTQIENMNEQFVKMTINGSLVIKDISLPSDKVPHVEWPRSEQDQKNDSNTIWFDELELKDALADCVESRTTVDRDTPELEITIDRFNEYEQDSIRGFIDVTINGAMTINGLKLMYNENDGEYWIAWPSRQGGDGNWYDLFWAPEHFTQTIIKQVQ